MSPRIKWYGLMIACAIAGATAHADDTAPAAPDAKATTFKCRPQPRRTSATCSSNDADHRQPRAAKVMVIVPWKTAEPAALAGRPINNLVEEVLTPIDRDVSAARSTTTSCSPRRRLPERPSRPHNPIRRISDVRKTDGDL